MKNNKAKHDSSLTIIPEAEIKMPTNAERISLSETIKANYGCKNCEWRYTGKCPHGLKPGEAIPEGICKKREEHLKQYYRGPIPRPGDKIEPAMTIFEADYNQGLAQQIMQSDFTAMMMFERKLENPNIDETEKARLESQLRNRRKQWERLWKKLREFQEKRIDRETPKEVNMTVKKISPADVASLLKTIDAEEEQ